jgi:predicted O-methyltransferase YrrM
LRPQNFRAERLASCENLEIDGIFTSPRILNEWIRDHAAISRVYGRDERNGAVNPGDRRALYYLIRALRPQHVLEVGTHIGASTLYIAKALIANGSGSITTLDIRDVNSPNAAWSKVGLSMSPLNLAEHLRCNEQIDFIVAPAMEYMKSSAERFDLIFLDGNHRAPDVYQEIYLSLEILRPDGLVLLHDFYPNGIALFSTDEAISGPYFALRRIVQESPAIAVIPLGKLPWPTKSGSHMTTLALVTRQ